MKICPKCKVEVADDAKFCATCGYAFEAAAPTVNVTVEKSAEETFDHKPLVMEWYQSNGFARFMFNGWPKINVIGTLVSVLCSVLGILAAFLGLITNVLGMEGFSGVLPLGLSLLSFALGLRALLYGVDLVFGNRLKKILFAGFLKNKGIDLDVAAKYVFEKISASNFSSVNKRDKGSLAAWLETPQAFGEAVMMAAKPETKKTNLIWMIVLAAVGFVCQSILAGAMTSILGAIFSIDFELANIGAVIGAAAVGIFFVIVATIADIIVTSIGMKKMSEAKAVWAVTVNNPEAAENVTIISA